MIPSHCAKLATHIKRIISFFWYFVFNFSFSLSFGSGFSLIFCINLLQNQQEPSSHQRLVLIIKNA